ncbi:uncharacterized protein N7469_001480 [Penicillium citrinum]|uniref:Uncharacterized protein n=1 Tax=Penicillium citrinum TaxID=5077 RepID=A0A9W9PF87_PENCI|nr:uncharacterized protein N7469_001480 [Penicillium citrinum]KAJ5243153.1 hypothetical protein N7469_001480 [Penicillium citrinum]
MSDKEDETTSSATPFTSSPPSSPPPTPPSLPEEPSFKVSNFVLKMMSTPDYFYKPENPPPGFDPYAAPTGPYLFYCTLSDPAMLRDVLELEAEPQPRLPSWATNAIFGANTQLSSMPHKRTFMVLSITLSRRRMTRGLPVMKRTILRLTRVTFTMMMGIHPMDDYGYVFQFADNSGDLRDGTFDLETWLRNMQRISYDHDPRCQNI